MANNDKEAFRLGFLTRCAEEGLTGEKLEARLAAVSELTKEGSGNWSLLPNEIKSTATNAGLAMLGLPIGFGLLGGGALGYGAAKLQEPALDEDEIKAREIANTYKVFAARAKARRKSRQYRPTP